MSKKLVEPIENYGLSQKNRPKSLFSKIGIVGCGTTGQVIARMASSKDIEVVFLELTEEKISETFKDIENDLNIMIERWGMTESEKRAVLSRIIGTISYKDFQDCDLVIEAILSKVREDSVDIRKAIFKHIEKNVSEKAIIATNSSTLVITELASELKHPERCVSLHFSTQTNEPKVIEVAKGLHTTDEAYKRVLRFIALLGKTAIPVEESPGLIGVRLIASLINEACNILLEGVGTKEDIDLTMRVGYGLPLGPFETADKIGLDRVVKWMNNLYDEFGDFKYKASPIIKRLVRANHLGRKSGEGFYSYNTNGTKIK